MKCPLPPRSSCESSQTTCGPRRLLPICSLLSSRLRACEATPPVSSKGFAVCEHHLKCLPEHVPQTLLSLIDVFNATYIRSACQTSNSARHCLSQRSVDGSAMQSTTRTIRGEPERG